MKITILDIHESDVWYKFKDELIGEVFVTDDMFSNVGVATYSMAHGKFENEALQQKVFDCVDDLMFSAIHYKVN